MTTRTPKPMTKLEISKTVVKFERNLESEVNTLSRFFDENVRACWDVSRMNAAELVVLHEKLVRKPRAELMLIEVGR